MKEQLTIAQKPKKTFKNDTCPLSPHLNPNINEPSPTFPCPFT